jgi:hypothetical protein
MQCLTVCVDLANTMPRYRYHAFRTLWMVTSRGGKEVGLVRYRSSNELSLYMANRAARHGTGTSTARHGTTGHGTARHGRRSVPCLLVPACWALGPGTALPVLNRAVSCHAKRHGHYV